MQAIASIVSLVDSHFKTRSKFPTEFTTLPWLYKAVFHVLQHHSAAITKTLLLCDIENLIQKWMEQEKKMAIPVSFSEKCPIPSIELSLVSFLDSLLLLKDVHEQEYRLYCPFLLELLKHCEHLNMLKCRLSQPRVIYLPKHASKFHFITCSAILILVPHVKYLPKVFSDQPSSVIEIPPPFCFANEQGCIPNTNIQFPKTLIPLIDSKHSLYIYHDSSGKEMVIFQLYHNSMSMSFDKKPLQLVSLNQCLSTSTNLMLFGRMDSLTDYTQSSGFVIMRMVDETGIIDVKVTGHFGQTLKYASIGDFILLEYPQLIKESAIPLFCMEEQPHVQMTILHNFSCLLHDSDLLSLDDRCGLGFILATVYAWKFTGQDLTLMIDDGNTQFSCTVSEMAIQRIFELRKEELDCIPQTDIERMLQQLVGKRFDFFLRTLTFNGSVSYVIEDALHGSSHRLSGLLKGVPEEDMVDIRAKADFPCTPSFPRKRFLPDAQEQVSPLEMRKRPFVKTLSNPTNALTTAMANCVVQPKRTFGKSLSTNNVIKRSHWSSQC